MSYIDFSNIPKIRESISEQEIQNLNAIFQQSQIIEQLEEIEKNRIKRRGKVFITLFIACFLITIFF